MRLILYRRWQLPLYTIGRLFIAFSFFCNTLEDTVRKLKDLNNDGDFDDPEEGKIYGDTAIPEGNYRITLEYSPTFKRVLPYLHDVPGFSGVMIHSGNSQADTKGCILVGENKLKGRVINSRAWELALTEKIREAINKEEEVTISISN